ncbi:hypothetical protein B0H66DRAFT_631541 [Apodospora peruviana]|uniref:Uncharacterized protein n=1 Tax=Apodospora peruviana TaxID=516989 RepID=A0AAE0HTS4_9PEZI|nr:hypothetical protein B0H66DRAFT_631541 [Apodospora peruviana]
MSCPSAHLPSDNSTTTPAAPTDGTLLLISLCDHCYDPARLVMWGRPDVLKQNNKDAASWYAILTVQCESLPRLMKEGLLCNPEANIVKERGSVGKVDPSPSTLGYPLARTWILEDVPSNNEPGAVVPFRPQCTGCLTVWAHTTSVLANFKLGETISAANFFRVCGTNHLGHSMYNFEAENPHENINCVYDGMPLRGWWPWPRAADADADTKTTTQGNDLYKAAAAGSGSGLTPSTRQQRHENAPLVVNGTPPRLFSEILVTRRTEWSPSRDTDDVSG